MATDLETMRARLRLDADGFSTGIEGASKQVSGFRGLLASAGSTAAGFLAANVIQRGIEGFKNQIGGIITAGSDLNETVSKTQVVFGDSFGAISKWAKTSAKDFGLSKQEAFDTVSTYGAMAKAAGQGGDAAVKFGTDLVGAAADLGSFWNFDPSQVAEDIRSGLAGESEPLRKYNIYLNEAAVQAKALEMGLVDSNGELSDENKILARKALIMEQLGPAAGDFAKTQKGLANGTRILKAYFKDFQAFLGAKVVPTLAKGVAWTNTMIARFQRLRSKGLSPTQALLKAARIELYHAFGRGTLNAITSVARGFVALYDGVKLWGGSLIDAFRSGSKVSDLVNRFPKPLQGMANGLLTIADAAGDAFAAFRTGGFTGLVDQLGPSLKQALGGIGDLVREFAGFAVDLGSWTLNVGIPTLGGWIADIAGDLWGWVKGQLGIGTSATGDGTGGPDTDRTVSVGSWVLDVAAPALLKWTQDFGAWLWAQIKGAWNGVLDAGTVYISASFRLTASVDWAGIKTDIASGLRAAVSGAVYSFSPVDMFSFTFAFGQALGPALASAVSSAFNAFKADPFGSAIVAAKIAAGVTAILAAPVVLPALLVSALAVWVGAGILGLASGIASGALGIDFTGIGTAIYDKVKLSIDAVTTWGEALVGKGSDLIGGLSGDIDTAVTNVLSVSVSGVVSAIITPFSTAGTWLVQAATDVVTGFSDTISLDTTLQLVTTAMGDVIAKVILPFVNAGDWLVQAGRDAVQGLIDGATEKLGFLQGVVDTIKGIWQQIPLLGHSPWPMMIQAGKDAMDGLIIGGESRIPRLVQLMDNVMETVSIGPAMSARAEFSGSSAFSARGGGGGDTYIILEGNNVIGDNAEQWIRGLLESGSTAKIVDRRISSRRLGESY